MAPFLIEKSRSLSSNSEALSHQGASFPFTFAHCGSVPNALIGRARYILPIGCRALDATSIANVHDNDGLRRRMVTSGGTTTYVWDGTDYLQERT